MREISEATLAILKSQNLTGQNRFSHSLKLEGTEYYSDITKTLTNTVLPSAQWADYAIRSDGKVLLAYLSGTGIYLKVIDSEENMLSIADSGSGGILFYTLGEIRDKSCFVLKKLKNGQVLLVINDIGNYTNNIPFTLKIFKSINGLGNDFTLVKTLFSKTRVSPTNNYCRGAVAKPCQLADGAIFITAWENYNFMGYDYGTFVIYKSTDNGLNWSKKYTKDWGYSLSGQVSNSSVRNMICVGNFCIVNMTTTGLVAYASCAISNDGGESWTHYDDPYTGIPTSKLDNTWHELIDFVYGIDNILYMIIATTDSNASLYKTNPPTILTFDYINNMNNWALIQSGISRYDWSAGFLSISPKGTIHYLHTYQGNIMRDTGLFRDEYSAELKASSISISKGKGGSNTATIQANNKDGVLNPKNPDSPLFGILGTNKQIIIKQGYAEEMVETFTGMIDDFDMSTWPQTTGVALRDNLKKALDQTVTEENQHTVNFVSQPIENIVGYLCYLANIEVGIIEPTEISVAMNFSWCSYADAFQQLGDLASFEWGCDSYGKFYFRRDYQPDNMYVAYTFEEGIDLATLKYKISDKDLYSKVVVFGKSGDDIISYEAPFLDAALYNVLPQKILKIDATEASTVGALRKIAERALSMMQSRTAVVNFESIAIPWLEPGDFIGIYERSTGAASIYRLSDLSFNMDKDSFKMSGTAYYYGDSIVPGELPTDIATQTVAPTTNLIPEMTSNTAPSGVARASSIYTSNYEPWQAFNSHSDDYYWNSITNTGWIEYQFTEKTIVDKYMLKARQLTIYNDAMPRDWTFEGFDGEKWIILDRQTEQTNWGVYQSRTYLFANITAYSKYRLYVSRNDGYMRLQLEQLAMYYGGGA